LTVTLKVSHLHAVKRMFRYLKGKAHLGLWYPKDSPFNLVAYSDSDYTRASLDRKSTIGGCQFLCCRLISWQCKKQSVVATSSTEAEYVAVASCCAQVLWIQNQLLDYGHFITTVSYTLMLFGLTKDVVQLMLLGHTHNMIAFLTKSDASEGFDQIVYFLNAYTIQYALMVNPPIYVSCIKQFWASVSVTKTNDVVKLQALIDRKKVIVTKDTIRQDLRLDDVDGVETSLFDTMLVQPEADAENEDDNEGKIAELDVDEDVTLVDVDTTIKVNADIQERMEEDVTAVKEINDAESEPIAGILDEKLAKRLQDEETEQAAAREKLEKEDFERVKVLQQQYDQKHENINWNVVVERMQEKHLDNIKKYHSLKRKPISIAQARKNMIVYLKNMAGYKMEHFKGMTYDQKRVAKETLLQKKFKKLRAEVKVLGSHSSQQYTLTVDPIEMSEEDVQNMLQIIPMAEFKVEPLQVKIHNIHQRSITPFHLAEKDHELGNLKFVPKGEKDEVFEMTIPNKLISKNISMASYYCAYLEMAAKHNRIITAEKEGKKKPTTAKQPKPNPTNEKSSKPAPVSKPKATKEKLTKPSPAKPSKLRKGRTLAWEEGSTGPSAQPYNNASANIVYESSSLIDSETGADSDKPTSGDDTKILHIDEDQGKDVDNQVNLEEKTVELDQGQTGSDPGLGVSRMDLVGPNPKPTHEEFMANVYPDVHESLKLPVDEHVILEEPLSSSGTLSSMKNLDDAYTYGDQFLNDKSTEYEPRKLNMDSKVVSMVTVLILQASSSVPPLSTPIIDKLTAFKQKSKTLDNSTQNLGSKVFTLKLQDLPYKIDQTVNTVVNEAVHIALQAPLRDHFKELPEADIKEILQQRMDEFLAKKDKSRKRHPPQSLAWKTSNTRETPSSSSKEQSACHSEQLIEDVPITDNVNVLDSKDTDITHLPKLKTKPD
nr:uncharacterized mitochondrial protein AtMg00810-like [Tanacetum cinerariifolium]